MEPSISGENRSSPVAPEIGFAGGDVLDGRVLLTTPRSSTARASQFKAGFETSAPGCKTANFLDLTTQVPAPGQPWIPTYGAPPVYRDVLYLDDTSAKSSRTTPGARSSSGRRGSSSTDGTKDGLEQRSSAGRAFENRLVAPTRRRTRRRRSRSQRPGHPRRGEHHDQALQLRRDRRRPPLWAPTTRQQHRRLHLRPHHAPRTTSSAARTTSTSRAPSGAASPSRRRTASW